MTRERTQPNADRHGCGAPASATSDGRTVSLSVLPARRVRVSRNSRRRAFVLISVHLLMGVHLVQWWLSGRSDGVPSTLSPVEPSESMYTLEAGRINAGFIFFCAALLATVLFGRFVCGWTCHVVALQDLCAHWMKKLGVHPKPLRSRFLFLGPLLVGFYMFVFPTLRRDAIAPALHAAGLAMPTWLGEVQHFPGFSNALVIEDFWRTMPPWYVAVPFLLVCGFATVYFLGAKGFCFTACPYGGLFGPADKLSIGKIVVNDNCDGCGHCTAVCTSNVRVHEEVRDYGMVVNNGCMKCLDCVSVCPTDALAFKFAAPAIFKKLRPTTDAGGARTTLRHDLSLWEDAALCALAVLMFMGYRGLFNTIPLLMAGGFAGIGAAAGWKLWSLARRPNVRLQNLQLRLKGRLTPWGRAFVPVGAAIVGVGLWGGVVRYHLWRAELIDAGVTAPFDAVFSPGYTPDPAQAARAGEALHQFTLGGPIRDGGLGWWHTGGRCVRIAWLHAVRGDLAQAERYLRLAVANADPNDDWVAGLVRVRLLRGDGPTQIAALYDQLLRERPALQGVRLGAAALAAQLGDPAKAATLAQQLLDARPAADAERESLAVGMLLQLGRTAEALAGAERSAARRPKSADLQLSLGIARAVSGDGPGAVAALRRATVLVPDNADYGRRLAEVLRSQGRSAEADAEDARVAKLAAGR